MLRRIKALGVATLLGSAFGVVAALGFQLYDPVRLGTPLFDLALPVALAQMGAVAGFTFALALWGWFAGTGRVPGWLVGGLLGVLSSFVGLQVYLGVHAPTLCLAGSSMWGFYATTLAGAPFGSFVAAIARSGDRESLGPGPDAAGSIGPGPLPSRT